MAVSNASVIILNFTSQNITTLTSSTNYHSIRLNIIIAQQIKSTTDKKNIKKNLYNDCFYLLYCQISIKLNLSDNFKIKLEFKSLE